MQLICWRNDFTSQDIVSRLISIGKNPEELAVQSTKLMIRHTHHIESALIEHVGVEKAIQLYWEIYKPFCETGWQQTKDKLGVKEIKDLATFAKVLETVLASAWALLFNVKELSEDRMIGEVTFCPNPVYGTRPEEVYLDLCRYYHYESVIITKIMLDYWLDISGLSNKYETKLSKIMCLGDDSCEFIIERKRGKSNH